MPTWTSSGVGPVPVSRWRRCRTALPRARTRPSPLTDVNHSDVISGVTAADETAMERGLNKALVHQILTHALDFPWRMQAIGLLGLRLDDHRQYRLHVWDPTYYVGEPPVHDHPYDFVSTVIAGQITNTRYEETASGAQYRRVRYSASDEDVRRTDTVRLSATSATLTEGEQYAQSARELHDSRHEPGTVTIIRCTFKDVAELTVCLRGDDSFVSGQARPATLDEVKHITTKALTWF